MATRKKRIVLCFVFLWWEVCSSLVYGEIEREWENSKAGFWTGIAGETCLGKHELGLWGMYHASSWGMKARVGYGWWEEFLQTEADDYGYREVGTLVPESYTGDLQLMAQWHNLSLIVTWQNGVLRVGEYVLHNTDWKAEMTWRGDWWWSGVGYSALQWQAHGGGVLWWERCHIGASLALFGRETFEVHGTAFLWNREKTLGLWVLLPIFREYHHREIATLGWKKSWERWFCSGEVGLSVWDAGRIQGEIGWKW